jgi:hypothetical protein
MVLQSSIRLNGEELSKGTHNALSLEGAAAVEGAVVVVFTPAFE